MQKDFFKHSAIYTLAVFFNRGVAFLLLPITTHYLHPNDYGILDFITVAGSFVAIFCGIELYQGMARYLADSQDFKDKRILFSSTISYIIFAYSIFIILANIFHSYTYKYIVPINANLLFNCVLFIYFFQGINVYFTNLLRFELKPQKTVILDAVPGFINIIFNILFIIVLHLGLTGALLASLLASITGTIIGIYFVKDYLTIDLDIKKIRSLILFCMPLVVSALSSIIMNYSDRIMLKNILSLSDLGIFGVGYRFASVITIFMSGISVSIYPLIYKSMNNIEFKAEFSKLASKFFIISILVIMLINIFAEDVIHLMVAKDFYNAVTTLHFMSIAIFFSQLYIFTPGLHINKRLNGILLLNLFGGSLNLILCYFLISTIGLNGASIATMISNIALFLLYLFFSQKQIYFDFEYKKILANLAAVVIFSLCNILLINDSLLLKLISTIIFLSLYLLANNLFRKSEWNIQSKS